MRLPTPKKTLRSLIALVVAWGCATVAFLVLDGLLAEPRAADVCVVLGSQVYPTGEPSPRLRARLDAGLDLYQRGLCPLVIVSGAVGWEGVDEAVVMQAYLIQSGVPAAHVLVDSGGATTYLTAKNGVALMRERGLRSAIVVSQYFHLTRSKLAFRRLGAERVEAMSARFFEWRDLFSVPREAVAVWAYLWRLS